MNQVLFVCTRNICSSRVAEALFNQQVQIKREKLTRLSSASSSQSLGKASSSSGRSSVSEAASQSKSDQWLPDWRADSRGFEVSTNLDSPISQNAVAYLDQHGLPSVMRMPIQLEPSDLLWSDLIIALNETEHRSIIDSRYGAWSNRIEYWNVADFHESNWGKSVARLEANISELINLLIIREKLRACSSH